MKLNKILAFALVATLLFAMPIAFAEETADSQVTSTEVDAETVAEVNDNLDESVTPVRIGWENVKLWFTFNNEKKAMQELRIARLRLIQARIAARNNDTLAMQNALEAHNRILERIQARINAIDGASDKEGSRRVVDKLVGLERAIEVHEARISRLNALLASENLSEEQKAIIEARLEKAENNTVQLREIQAQKKEKIKTRLRAVSNMTEEEADEAIREIEESQNLSAVRKLVAEVRLRNTERVMEVLRARIAAAEAEGRNVSGLRTAMHSMETIRERIQERQEAELQITQKTQLQAGKAK
ncbi:MAG: hypothetical protein QXS38_01620 [Candidatus Pacearchaeota archaeon]